MDWSTVVVALFVAAGLLVVALVTIRGRMTRRVKVPPSAVQADGAATPHDVATAASSDSLLSRLADLDQLLAAGTISLAVYTRARASIIAGS